MIKELTLTESNKLNDILMNSIELSDENKEKVCIIEDIFKLSTLINNKVNNSEIFYTLYEFSTKTLEEIQYGLQINYNTLQYKKRLILKLQEEIDEFKKLL